MVPTVASNAQAVSGSYALVKNPSNATADLALADLMRIYKGDQQFWSSGKKITLIVPEPETPEKKVLLDKVYRMSEEEFHGFWLKRVFRGEVLSGPLVLPDAASTIQFVASHEGAVGLVNWKNLQGTAAGRSVKILTIDGRSPSEKNYVLSH